MFLCCNSSFIMRRPELSYVVFVLPLFRAEDIDTSLRLRVYSTLLISRESILEYFYKNVCIGSQTLKAFRQFLTRILTCVVRGNPRRNPTIQQTHTNFILCLPIVSGKRSVTPTTIVSIIPNCNQITSTCKFLNLKKSKCSYI